MNFKCRITTLPFGSHCNKRWSVNKNLEGFGANIQDYDLNIWFQDRSVTLECKNKGKQEYIESNTLKCLVNSILNKMKDNHTSIHSCNIYLPEIFRGLYILFLWFL